MAKTDKTTPEVEFSTNLHNIFDTDETLEEAGAWVTVNELMGLKVKIRRLRSDAVVKAFERIVRETYAEDEELVRKPQGMSEDQSLYVLKRQLSEAVLIDWTGVRDTKTGKEVPYSPQAAFQMMGMKDFREFVYQKANDRETFREKSDEEAEGNSSGS